MSVVRVPAPRQNDAIDPTTDVGDLQRYFIRRPRRLPNIDFG